MVTDDTNCYNSIYQDLIELIGFDNALKIYSRFNGQQISLPKRLYSKEYVEKKVIEEYNGSNVKQLAQKYSYTERWVSSKLKNTILK